MSSIFCSAVNMTHCELGLNTALFMDFEGVWITGVALYYRIARNLGGQNFGECARFCFWRLIFWRPAPGSRIAVIEKQNW